MKFAVPSPDKGKTERGRLQNSRFFFLKISKEIGKAWLKSLTSAKRARLTVFSLIPDLLFDCSCVLEYAKIRTVSQSRREGAPFFLCRGEGSTSRRHCAQPKTLSNGVANYIIKDKVRNIFNSTYTSVKVTFRSASLRGVKV